MKTAHCCVCVCVFFLQYNKKRVRCCKTGHLRHGSGIRMYSVKSWRLVYSTNRTGRDSCSYQLTTQSTAELDFVIRLFLSRFFCVRSRTEFALCRTTPVLQTPVLFFCMLEDRFSFIASKLTQFNGLENVPYF